MASQQEEQQNSSPEERSKRKNHPKNKDETGRSRKPTSYNTEQGTWKTKMRNASKIKLKLNFKKRIRGDPANV